MPLFKIQRTKFTEFDLNNTGPSPDPLFAGGGDTLPRGTHSSALHESHLAGPGWPSAAALRMQWGCEERHKSELTHNWDWLFFMSPFRDVTARE